MALIYGKADVYGTNQALQLQLDCIYNCKTDKLIVFLCLPFTVVLAHGDMVTCSYSPMYTYFRWQIHLLVGWVFSLSYTMCIYKAKIGDIFCPCSAFQTVLSSWTIAACIESTLAHCCHLWHSPGMVVCCRLMCLIMFRDRHSKIISA